MDESVKLIVEKLEQLAVALQINISEIFPYFVLKARIGAILVSILFPVGTFILYRLTKKALADEWEEIGVTILIIGTIILGIITMFVLAYDAPTIFIPEPQAIKDIMELFIPQK